MSETWAASSSPLMASIDTVAGWPTLTLVMSDSEKATVIVIVLASTISTNGVLEEPLPDEDEDAVEEPPEPRPPAAVAPPAAAPEPLELDPLLEEELAAEPVDPAETVSPGASPAIETIVPLAGAYRLHLASVCSAVRRLASAESIEA